MKDFSVKITQEMIDYIVECGLKGKTPTPEDVKNWEDEERQRKIDKFTQKLKQQLTEGCEKARALNTHGFRPGDIVGAEVLDKEKFEKLAWFNDAMNCWAVSWHDKDDEDSFFAEFRDGVCVSFSCSSYGGMCGYKFDEFFDPENMDCMFDLELQKAMVKLYNRLSESGALKFPTHD